MKINIEKLQAETEVGVATRQEKEKQNKLKAEEKAKADAERAVEQFNKDVAWRFREVESQIFKCAKEGSSSTTYQIDNDSQVAHRLEKMLVESNIQCRVTSEWYPTDNGDPDSGEGRHDSGTTYTLHISWLKKSSS